MVTNSCTYQVDYSNTIVKRALKNQMRFVCPEVLSALDQTSFDLLKNTEAIVTYDTDLHALLQKIVAKAEEASKQFPWEQALNCIIFVVDRQRFEEIKSKRHEFASIDLRKKDSVKNLDYLKVGKYRP